MIALLHGRVASLGEDRAVIVTGGVGYEVHCHVRTIAALHEQRDGDVTLHVHTAVSDDAIRLYGFVTEAELRLFRVLITVNGVGSKLALGVLGRAELPVLVRAIRSEDAGLLVTVPGVGRKTADRVILELRGKLDGMALPGDIAVAATAPPPAANAAVEMLVSLGFREPEARGAVNAALDGEAEVETAELVSRALRQLDRATA